MDGWFHTGDMARMDDDGFYTIAGRFKDMIISGGENIYAAEVEKVFRDHPAVQDAALIGLPDHKWGEVGLMVVVLKAGQHGQRGRAAPVLRQPAGPLQGAQAGGLRRRAAGVAVWQGDESGAQSQGLEIPWLNVRSRLSGLGSQRLRALLVFSR